jgi:hypothetical protein
MNARFFYAAPIFSNSPKLMVLTDDAVLYTEHREFEVIKVEKQSDVDFNNFVEKDYENEDYPVLLEIGYEEARNMPLAGQANWIDRYVTNMDINIELALQA